MASKRRPEKLKLIADPGERDIFGEGDDSPDRDFDFEPSRRRDGDGPRTEQFDDLNGPPRRRLWPLALALAIVVVFGGLVWYAYDWGIEQVDTARLPLILADPEPIKSKPEAPGGMEVPHQDKLVLNQNTPDPNTPQVERLLPPPEVPKPPKALVPESAPPAETAAERTETRDEVAGQASPPAEPVPAAPVAPQPEASAKAATAATAEPAPVPPEPSQPEPRPQPAPSAVELTAASTPTTTQTAARPQAQGAYVVQLAALKSPDATQTLWAQLQRAHPRLLGDTELTVQRVDLGNRGVFYRVQAGFFPDRSAANGLCQALKARQQDCLVVRR